MNEMKWNGQFFEETDYSMQFDEAFVLLSDSRLVKDSLFCTFTIIAVIWNFFLYLTYKPTQGNYKTKQNNKNDAGITRKDICGQKFKKLQAVTLPSLYSLEKMMFVIKCPDMYENNVSNRSRDMRQIADFIYNQ